MIVEYVNPAEFLDFLRSELSVLENYTPALILKFSSDQEWTDENLVVLGKKFADYLKRAGSKSKFVSSLSLWKRLSFLFHEFLHEILFKRELILVPHGEQKSNKEIDFYVLGAKYDNIFQKIMSELTEKDKEILYKYFFIYLEVRPERIKKIMKINQSVREINQGIKNISKLIVKNFTPKTTDEIIDFFRAFIRYPEVDENLIEDDLIVRDPLFVFLRNANCPAYDLLKKYKENKLKDKHICNHVACCAECQKRLQNIFLSKIAENQNCDFLNDFLDSEIITDNKCKDLAVGQIWSTKSTGDCHYPYMVLIMTKPDDFFVKKPVVRVRPISLITEFRSKGDFFVKDQAYLGRSFIVETWNEQPMFVSDLMNYAGEIENWVLENSEIKSKNRKYTKRFIESFRSLEIASTEYLRGPVMGRFW